ncbi:MAG: hypothetical protein ACKV2O_12060 [Acidimicrobiales bacterium]
MIQAPGGPSPAIAPQRPTGPDPLAAPRAALRAEWSARARIAPPDTDRHSPSASGSDAAILATFAAAIARLEQGDPAVRNAATVLGGSGPPGASSQPRLRLVPTGTCLHQRAIQRIGATLASGQTVLVITDAPAAFEALMARPIHSADPATPHPPAEPATPAESPEVTVATALTAASTARELAERAYHHAAAAHSAAREALRQLEPEVAQLRALEGIAQELLAADREACAGALGVGRLADELHHDRPQGADTALRRLLVAAELATSRAGRRNEVLARWQHQQRSLPDHGSVRVQLRRLQREIGQRRQDHALAEEQLRGARRVEAEAQTAADQAIRSRLADARLIEPQPGHHALPPNRLVVTSAAALICEGVLGSAPTFDLVLIEAADRLPPALLIPLCAAARTEVVLCAGAGRPPTPRCADPTHHHWLGANIDQILLSPDQTHPRPHT